MDANTVFLKVDFNYVNFRPQKIKALCRNRALIISQPRYFSRGIRRQNALSPYCEAQMRTPLRVMYGVYTSTYSLSIGRSPPFMKAPLEIRDKVWYILMCKSCTPAYKSVESVLQHRFKRQITYGWSAFIFPTLLLDWK